MNKDVPEIHDVMNIFSIISNVYQCSDGVREASYVHVGKDLMQTIFRSFTFVRESKYSEECSYYIVKVMKALSRVRGASVYMTLQDEALTILNTMIIDRGGNYNAEIEAIATLKNITLYAEQCGHKILHHPGIFDGLLKSCTDRDVDISREIASAVIRNLAMASDTKAEMLGHSSLLDILMELLDDENIKTRRNAISIVINLAISLENGVVFVTHGEGVLLQIIHRLMEEDNDYVVRRRSVRALRYFGSEETIEMIAGQHGIVESLLSIVKYDPCVEVQLEAIDSFASLAYFSHSLSWFYESILESLTQIANFVPHPFCLEALAKTLNTLSCHREHRQGMIHHYNLLSTIPLIASDPMSTMLCREQCVSAIYNFTLDKEHRGKMASCIPYLSAILSNRFRGDKKTQTNAVKALANLVEFEKNKKCVAQESGLMYSLIDFASISDNLETKETIKAIITNMIPSL